MLGWFRLQARVLRAWAWTGVGIGAVIGSGCRPAPTPGDSDVVARVGVGVVTLAQYESELRRRGGMDDPRRRETVLEDLIRTELLVQQAYSSGFADSPELRRRLGQSLARAYEEELRRKDPAPPLPDGAAEAYYREHPEEFRLPERVRLAGILVRVPRKAEESARGRAVAKAAALHAEAVKLPAGEPGLGELARLYSEDTSTRYAGGDQGWMTPAQAAQRWPGAETALAALREPGAVAPVVASDDGLWILRLMEREESRVRPWTDPQVRELAAHRASVEWEKADLARREAALREGIAVEIDRAVLARLPAPAPKPASPGTPPALPGAGPE